jgi:hypothetical protein
MELVREFARATGETVATIEKNESSYYIVLPTGKTIKLPVTTTHAAVYDGAITIIKDGKAFRLTKANTFVRATKMSVNAIKAFGVELSPLKLADVLPFKSTKATSELAKQRIANGLARSEIYNKFAIAKKHNRYITRVRKYTHYDVFAENPDQADLNSVLESNYFTYEVASTKKRSWKDRALALCKGRGLSKYDITLNCISYK